MPRNSLKHLAASAQEHPSDYPVTVGGEPVHGASGLEAQSTAILDIMQNPAFGGCRKGTVSLDAVVQLDRMDGALVVKILGVDIVSFDPDESAGVVQETLKLIRSSDLAADAVSLKRPAKKSLRRRASTHLAAAFRALGIDAAV